ncbi:MAG: PEP-CTERM sorting domain-containing protein [Phycisphaerales bacterium]|nr:MAG: PEP-CTERM sorting domain-containing protein [Phycisphaerales bacterium]
MGHPATFEFAGEITYVADDDGLLGGAVAVGSPFSGLYTFESTTPDSDLDEPRRGLYADTISFVSGEIAGIPFLGPLAPTDFVDVRDFPNTSFDHYLVYAEVELLSTALDFKLRLGDQSGTAFQSDSLPLVPPDLALFDSTRFAVFDGSETIPLRVEGYVTWLVPEPGTVVLLAFATLIILRRKKSGTQYPARQTERGK